MCLQSQKKFIHLQCTKLFSLFNIVYHNKFSGLYKYGFCDVLIGENFIRL